jgi:hypothetical protein
MTRFKVLPVAMLAACGVEAPQHVPDGLVLAADGSDRVGGSFGKDGVGIDFELTFANVASEARVK